MSDKGSRNKNSNDDEKIIDNKTKERIARRTTTE